MTNEKINITIAEAIGWRHNTGEEPRYGGAYRQAGWTSTEGVFTPSTWNAKTSSGLPDYCADLNAMHEAEETLDALHMQDFVFNLLRVVNAQTPGRTIAQLGCFAHIHATARQRAEAFLRTIGRWEDEK